VLQSKYALTSETKKVSVYEIKENIFQKNGGVRVRWVCDLKDAFRNGS
jgi:hypothetical protein